MKLFVSLSSLNYATLIYLINAYETLIETSLVLIYINISN